MFEPAKNFLNLATHKYKLGPQAMGALICTKSKKLIADEYPDFAAHWLPTQFSRGILQIKADNAAASSALFLRTHDLLEKMSAANFPQSVVEIRIVR